MSFTREQRIEFRRRAWELRIAGLTQQQIGAKLGLSQSIVSRMLARAREDATAATHEVATIATAEQIARLDRMLVALWEKVRNGNERAVDTVLRIEERRAKLLGLDAAVRKEVDITSAGKAVRFDVRIPVVDRIGEIVATDAERNDE